MNFLDRTLKKEGIYNEKDLRNYIANFPNDSPFTLINQENIYTVHKIDYDESEHRVFDKEVKFKLCIIDMPSIHFKDATEISFLDSVFTGNVTIPTQNKNSFICDCCIFVKDLVLGGPELIDNVTVYKCNIDRLYISGLCSNTLSIRDSNIGSLVVVESEIENFDTNYNKINNFWTKGSSFKHSQFKHDQININCFTGIRRLKYFSKRISEYLYEKQSNKLHKNKQLFEFTDTISKYALDPYHHDGDKQTLEFLELKTDIKNHRDHYSEVVLNNAIFNQKGIVAKFLIYSLGAFTRPTSFFLLGVFVYILYAFIYMLPTSYFVVNGGKINIGIIESLYFSGITFTTIGYGDIAPIGISRIFALTEGFLGILISSSFLVSLVRKYCD